MTEFMAVSNFRLKSATGDTWNFPENTRWKVDAPKFQRRYVERIGGAGVEDVGSGGIGRRKVEMSWDIGATRDVDYIRSVNRFYDMFAMSANAVLEDTANNRRMDVVIDSVKHPQVAGLLHRISADFTVSMYSITGVWEDLDYNVIDLYTNISGANYTFLNTSNLEVYPIFVFKKLSDFISADNPNVNINITHSIVRVRNGNLILEVGVRNADDFVIANFETGRIYKTADIDDINGIVTGSYTNDISDGTFFFGLQPGNVSLEFFNGFDETSEFQGFKPTEDWDVPGIGEIASSSLQATPAFMYYRNRYLL